MQDSQNTCSCSLFNIFVASEAALDAENELLTVYMKDKRCEFNWYGRGLILTEAGEWSKLSVSEMSAKQALELSIFFATMLND